MRQVYLIGLLMCACGGSSAGTPPAQTPDPEPAAPAVPEDPAPPPGALWRSDVTETLDRGLGVFLQRVAVEPQVRGGRFHGWRIVELRPADWWDGVDLKPGDVVTQVNGMPIERETEAFAAFESVRTSDELEVSYRRGGEDRSLVYRIVDRKAKSYDGDKDAPARVPSEARERDKASSVPPRKVEDSEKSSRKAEPAAPEGERSSEKTGDAKPAPAKPSAPTAVE